MRNVVCSLFFFQFLVVFMYAQVSKKDQKNKQDLSKTVDSLNIIYNQKYESKWLVYGISYESVNSNIGFSFGNGLKEKPIVHFEDISTRLLYDINFKSNFKNDYSYNIELGYDYPIPFSLLTLEVKQRHFISSNYFQRDINANGTLNLRNSKWSLLFKMGHQTLDSNNNLGVSLGLQKRHKSNFQKANASFYYGFLFGYYKSYTNYSAFINGFILKERLNFRFSFDRIKNYNFLTLGLNFVLYKNIKYESN